MIDASGDAAPRTQEQAAGDVIVKLDAFLDARKALDDMARLTGTPLNFFAVESQQRLAEGAYSARQELAAALAALVCAPVQVSARYDDRQPPGVSFGDPDPPPVGIGPIWSGGVSEMESGGGVSAIMERGRGTSDHEVVGLSVVDQNGPEPARLVIRVSKGRWKSYAELQFDDVPVGVVQTWAERLAKILAVRPARSK